jgi:Coenzyme PQQ synthesis protein D (PqqD)
MDFGKCYEICSPEVIAEDFDGDIFILNLEDGRYFSLRGAGPSVWGALTAGATPQEIVDGAQRDRPVLAESTAQFLHRLLDLQLIRIAGHEAAFAGASSVDWSSLSDEDHPDIEVFDDLAELILADPIHDVDAAAGWPMRKAG